MLAGHNSYLVSLSVAIAILGGYTGLGLAARLADTSGRYRRLLLVGAAAFLSVGIWTMHFIGMLAAPLPPGVVYLLLPTIVSFLICALVVGLSLFFVSGIRRPGRIGVAVSAILLGTGICSMHYVGIHGLAGHFAIEHDWQMVLLAVLIAIATAWGALSIFLSPQVGWRLALAAAAFGVAVSGMHYTAMAGMHFVEPGTGHDMTAMASGLQASPEVLSIVVACLCFMIAAGFLLFLMPDQWGGAGAEAAAAGAAALSPQGMAFEAEAGRPVVETHAKRIPLQGTGGATQFIDVAEIRAIRADAHYTWVHDGTRERMCSWSISEAEASLDPAIFFRVHRSHIVAMPHVILMRKEGDAAVIEVDAASPHFVPVSRARVAEVKARLGLMKPHSKLQAGKVG